MVRRTEAVNLDIPLLLKYRTDRLDNFAAYVLFGVKYMRDFQSQENVNQQLQSDNILRLQSGNFAAISERRSTCSCPFSSSPSRPKRNKDSSTFSFLTTAITPTLWNFCARAALCCPSALKDERRRQGHLPHLGRALRRAVQSQRQQALWYGFPSTLKRRSKGTLKPSENPTTPRGMWPTLG